MPKPPDDDVRYLQHVLEAKNLKPGALAKLAGIAGSTLTRRLNSDDYKFVLSTPTIKKIEAATGISFAEFLVRDPADPPAERPKPNASFPPVYKKFDPEASVPLKGQSSAGANGRFVLNGSDIASVFCPPDLIGVEGAYAVRVYGTSMEPRFSPGETVWLNPHTPVRAGDDVVAQILEDDGEVASYIKRFVSQSGSLLKLKQFNPDEGEKELLTFPADKVFSVHKVVFAAFV